MRIEFVVRPAPGGWHVARGGRIVGDFADRNDAIRAAENFARAAAETREKAVVKLVENGGTREHRSFRGDIF